MYNLSPAQAGIVILVLVAVFLGVLLTGIRRVSEDERGVIFRYGGLHRIKNPGWVHVLPFVERMTRVDTRDYPTELPPQEVTTADDVTVQVDSVISARVVDPARAVVTVDDHRTATVQVAQRIVRDRLSHCTRDELLDGRDEVNASVQRALEEVTVSWGIEIGFVNVTAVR